MEAVAVAKARVTRVAKVANMTCHWLPNYVIQSADCTELPEMTSGGWLVVKRGELGLLSDRLLASRSLRGHCQVVTRNERWSMVVWKPIHILQ